MPDAMGQRSKLVVLALLAGCNPYQRDPGYIGARLREIVTHPLRPDSLKYVSLALVFGLFACVVLVALARRPGGD